MKEDAYLAGQIERAVQSGPARMSLASASRPTATTSCCAGRWRVRNGGLGFPDPRRLAFTPSASSDS